MFALMFIRYPTIYIFSTGDELKSLNNTHSGHIRDTNSVMIKQILEQDNYRGQVLNCGIVRDKYVFYIVYIIDIFT